VIISKTPNPNIPNTPVTKSWWQALLNPVAPPTSGRHR